MRTVLPPRGGTAAVLLALSASLNACFFSFLLHQRIASVPSPSEEGATAPRADRRAGGRNEATVLEGGKKIVVNVGMPRTGTNSWMGIMKGLYADSGEFHHQLYGYDAQDLAELLLLGNRSHPENPLHRKLTRPPSGRVRAMADHPSFLLAPIARDFPHVHWIQVTREIESHINSTLYMLQTWCQDRCACDAAPRCSKGSMALIDRLYFDKFNALGLMCRNNGLSGSIPRDVMRAWLRGHEEETESHLSGHPHFLRLSLEDGPRTNMKRMVRFLGLNESALDSFDFDSFHANKRAVRKGS